MKAQIVHTRPEPTSIAAVMKDAGLAAFSERGRGGGAASDLHKGGFNPVAGRGDRA